MTNTVLSRFPKVRPALPPEIAEIYAKHYKSNRDGETAASSLAQRAEAWMHKKVAEDVRSRGDRNRSTLEIGAGTLNQLPYEPAVGPYDIIEPFSELYDGSKHLARIRHVYADLADVPAGTRYDRITSIAAFEHILNLPEVVARCGMLLADDGDLRVAIPSEGTILWTLGWKLTTGLEFRLKYGLDYGLLMRHEHVNTAREIADVLRVFFNTVTARSFGVSAGLSLYQFYSCRNPNTERCRDYLNGR